MLELISTGRKPAQAYEITMSVARKSKQRRK
jgi:hypothetical protein